jgi:ATP-dependent DNA helicase RecG
VEERPRIEGNLPEVWQEAVSVIGGLMRQPSRLVGNRFQAVSEYPRFSWQEALLNAIAHRDYSIQGNCIEVWLFDDRMEVVSPGGLLPELDLQELLSLKRVHCSRNPRLMRTLVDLGLTRDQGEGIPRMFAEMEDAFLPAPRIEPTARNVSVVLGNTTTLTEADRTFVERLAADELTQEEFRALLQAHRHTQVDNASLRQLMGLDTLAASQILRRLRDRELLDLHPAGSQSYYTLGPGLLAGDRPDQGKPVLDRGELAADRGELGPDRGELPADRGELGADRGESGPISTTVTAGDILDLDPALHQALASLGTRPRKEKLRQVIGLLCSDQWRSGAWLAQLLSYKPGNLANRHLGPMVKEGMLERRFPEKPNHPEQAYRVKLEQVDQP